MSALYGTLQSEKTGKATKTGNNILRATAQSYDGSISVSLNRHGLINIHVEEGSTDSPSRLVFQGHIQDLLNGRSLKYQS